MLQSERTVFTFPTLMALTGNYNRMALSKSLYYYRKEGLVRSPRSGIFVKEGYCKKEMACSLFEPCYISLSSVLVEAGVIFQYSDEFTVISALSRSVSIDGTVYRFRRINPFLWGEMRGIRQEKGYCIASPERAVLDTMFLFPSIGYFDNVRNLDFDFIRELSLDYKCKAFENRVYQWIKTNISSL